MKRGYYRHYLFRQVTFVSMPVLKVTYYCIHTYIQKLPTTTAIMKYMEILTFHHYEQFSMDRP